MFFFDPTWLLFGIPPMLVMLYAQHKVQSTYSRYAQEPNGQRASGVQVAERLLREHGLSNVAIEMSEGQLSDHYDPTSKTLRLSPDVYNNASVASLGIVAHEVGHAVQDAKAYTPMMVRASLVPAANFGSSLAPLLFFAGLIMQITGLVWIAIAFFSAAVLFHLVTLPVELNASSRARAMLTNNGMVTPMEFDAVDAVLKAAALTYVAALLQSMGQLAYFVMVATGMSRRDD